MKLKSILLTGAAISLLTPSALTTLNQPTVQAAKTQKNQFGHAKVNRFNTKWNKGFYDANISDPSNNPILLFSSLTEAKHFDHLSTQMDKTSSKDAKKAKAVAEQFNQAKNKALKFNDPSKQLKVKMVDKYYKAVKLNGKTYYATGGHNSGLSPYNVQYDSKTKLIESPLDPTAKQSNFAVKKGTNLKIHKGAKWAGPHTWEYNGLKWIPNKHVSFK